MPAWPEAKSRKEVSLQLNPVIHDRLKRSLYFQTQKFFQWDVAESRDMTQRLTPSCVCVRSRPMTQSSGLLSTTRLPEPPTTSQRRKKRRPKLRESVPASRDYLNRRDLLALV